MIDVACDRLVIDESRWSIHIVALKQNEIVGEWVASADSYYTDNDHIFFNTAAEYATYND